jgi:hypothetical protein
LLIPHFLSSLSSSSSSALGDETLSFFEKTSIPISVTSRPLVTSVSVFCRLVGGLPHVQWQEIPLKLLSRLFIRCATTSNHKLGHKIASSMFVSGFPDVTASGTAAAATLLLQTELA